MKKKYKIDDLLAYHPETGELRWKVSRGTARAGAIAGSLHSSGYICVMVFGRDHKAHRLAWFLTYGRWPIDEIDHINGRRSDNRIANLRECTHAENSQNRSVRKDNRSGFAGVSWHASTGKWGASITHCRKQRHLGLFSTPEQAHAAYLAAKAELHRFNPIPRLAA